MRFKDFLQEGKSFNIDKFKTDCSYYLGLLRGTHGTRLMYRGMYDTPADVNIETWKARTAPRDSSPELHNEMNKFFTSELGAPIRNWMFTTGIYQNANIYAQKRNDIGVIFPIGKFEWASADNDDGHDLTGFYDRCMGAVRSNDALKDKDYDEKVAIAIDMMKHKMQKWDWRMNRDLTDCIKDGNEIMLQCGKYYAFNMSGKTFQSDEIEELLYSL